MADHVRVREVDDPEPVTVSDLGRETGGDLGRRHLRLLVVRADVARRRNEDAGLARPLVLAAAVEEVRDVRVLLGLRHVQLPQSAPRQHFRHRLLHRLLLEGDGAVEVAAVAGHRGQVEAGLEQLLGQLARAVGAEVEEDRAVAVLEPRAAVDHDRLDELVGDARVVACPDGGDRVGGMRALAAHDGGVRALGSLPALVAVHRPVAPGHGRDPSDRELGEVVGGRVGRDVAPVGEGVDPCLLGREAEERLHVVDVRVDAAVRDETEEVNTIAPLEGAAERVILEEGAVLDRLVHTHQILVEDAPGPDRQMADLRVPHLPRGESNRLAGGLEGRVRVLAPEPVEDGRVGELHGIPRPGRRAAPAVEDDERYEAASQIAAKDSTSREAPPTSAPSTSG